jgi:hypothetical protein
MKLKVNEYIESGFSAEDAGKITPIIQGIMDSNSHLEIDFEGVTFFTTLFFNQSLTYLIGEMGLNEYDERISVSNLSESGQATYKHAYDYAIEYYRKPKEDQLAQDDMIDEEINNI